MDFDLSIVQKLVQLLRQVAGKKNGTVTSDAIDSHIVHFMTMMNRLHKREWVAATLYWKDVGISSSTLCKCFRGNDIDTKNARAEALLSYQSMCKEILRCIDKTNK